TQVYRYFGQERNNTTYNLARMNMLLHDVRYENFDIRNDDTLENPAFLGNTFDAVIANPPYSAKWTADSKFENDERFSGYGKLAPKSKADFAFIQTQVYRYFGQERNNTTYNLARMNMLLHDVRYENFDIRNDDTLENPAFLGHTFDAVIANPPYSAKWTADSKFENDERFSGYGKLAPKSKADFAFI
ncbi:N-6 DNA methylase, partial [Staphylococcus aureus]